MFVNTLKLAFTNNGALPLFVKSNLPTEEAPRGSEELPTYF